ncbi:uncharacterized protein LY89DRAFT_637739 [Mollisia scopiformis]|uniref:BTB domain-containing protein n=1 Tax=Mollisia scopiformis TaxID=149040 RepID=A0A194XNQ0_MOLSC|nr:uncharacterized protein LY89DRAFT_637739 [Mollisia scopiformis]KUJ21786.1 hypothetical protein LY89DRAFT_637739 [Mollisia scopiformis]
MRGTVVASMKVNRQVLIDNSQVFKAMMSSDGHWKETYASTIDMEVDNIPSVEVVLRALHGTMKEELYGASVSFPDVWEIIQFCSYRQIEVLKLKGWFAKWLENALKVKLDHDDLKMLLFPCYTFDHAKGFASMTKTLAYNSAEHTTEYNPTDYRHLHLDGNAIGGLNGARGSMRGKLLRGLFDPVAAFLEAKCDCKANALFAYHIGLSKTGIWPIHDHHKKSVQDILDSPGMINFQCTIPDGACSSCRSRLSSTKVTELRRKILNDFHGLCLDCMTMTKTGDIDSDYWDHDRMHEWDAGCRIQHSQPTWYFSYMGRKTDMKNHQKAMKRAK